MIQTFEIFKGDPAGLVAKLNALKASGSTIVQVMLTTAAANYLIISQK
jgi:hypothetical protein